MPEPSSPRSSSSPTRRDVMAGGAGLAATAALHATPLVAQKPKERVAVVGTGVRGTGLWGRSLLEDHSDILEMVALCDINPGRLEYGHKLLGLSCPYLHRSRADARHGEARSPDRHNSRQIRTTR